MHTTCQPKCVHERLLQVPNPNSAGYHAHLLPRHDTYDYESAPTQVDNCRGEQESRARHFSQSGSLTFPDVLGLFLLASANHFESQLTASRGSSVGLSLHRTASPSIKVGCNCCMRNSFELFILGMASIVRGKNALISREAQALESEPWHAFRVPSVPYLSKTKTYILVSR
eukprot:7469733-Pyramimonas_sp.AAC.1